MHLIVRSLRNIILGTILAIGLPSQADDFQDLAIYDEVQVEAETLPDMQVANDIQDAVGSEDSDNSAYEFANATPEPMDDSGLSKMANIMAHKKSLRKSKKSKPVAKVKGKKSNGKKRRLARN